MNFSGLFSLRLLVGSFREKIPTKGSEGWNFFQCVGVILRWYVVQLPNICFDPVYGTENIQDRDTIVLEIWQFKKKKLKNKLESKGT